MKEKINRADKNIDNMTKLKKSDLSIIIQFDQESGIEIDTQFQFQSTPYLGGVVKLDCKFVTL